MRLRQIALVASDLRSVEEALIQQLGLEMCYRDPGLAGFGLRHGLYPIGDHILEVVVPRQPGTTAERFLERRGGDGGYMVLVQTDDLDRERSRVIDDGFRIVHDGGTVQPTMAPGESPARIHGIHLHPKDVGGAILSIDQSDPPESWGWAGYDWEYHSRTDVVNDLTAIEIQADDPDEMASRWARALAHDLGGNKVDGEQADGREIVLSDATIRFVEATDGRGDGLAAVDLAATDRGRAGETIDICGTRFNLV
ncbi:MAG: VOC family protein [Acidimicrobiales bacterium]